MRKFLFLLYILFLLSGSFVTAEEGKQFLYVSRFLIGPRGGVKQLEVEQIRSEILEKVGKYKKYQLVGPEAEEAIRQEQFKIESEGGSGMMCRAEECRRRLLKVASADVLIEGTLEMLDSEIAQVRLEVHSRKISETQGGQKEQSIKVIIQKFKTQSDPKDKLRMLGFVSELLSKKISGELVTEEEEEMASGLKPLDKGANWSGAWRSAIVPGWGQVYKNQPIRGGAYFVLFAGAAGALASSSNRISLAKSEYNDSTFLPLLIPYSASDTNTRLFVAYFFQNSSRPAYENSVNVTNAIGGGLIAIYLWNIFDALVFQSSSSAKKLGFLDREEQRFSFGFNTSRSPPTANYATQKSVDYSFYLTWRF